MRNYCNAFTIDGKPILAPDGNMPVSKSDLDTEDTGRDESGYMHRSVLRERVGQWEFRYSSLTYCEYQYMTSLFEGKSEFDFEIKTPTRIVSKKAYCSSVSANLVDVKNWKYSNVSFKLIEC